MSRPVALVPGVRALLPRYASLEDPVSELRAACLAAVGELGPRVRVLASSEAAAEVGAALVVAAGAAVVDEPDGGKSGVLLVANGSARRTEKAPGHLDERAAAFDAATGSALAGDRVALGRIDTALAAELWADTETLTHLRVLVDPGVCAELRYDDAPYGVQYWVAVWLDGRQSR